MYECGDESSRLRNHLADLHLVTYGDYRLRRGSEMLSHGDIDSLRQRENLYGAVAREFAVIWMDTADPESYFAVAHVYASFLVSGAGAADSFAGAAGAAGALPRPCCKILFNCKLKIAK